MRTVFENTENNFAFPTLKKCYPKTLFCALNLVFFVLFRKEKKDKPETKHVFPVFLIFENRKQF